MEAEAEIAGSRARAAGVDPTLLVEDFFDLHVNRLDTFDAIIGNPPRIRDHSFVGEQRANAQRRTLAMGVRMTGLASS